MKRHQWEDNISCGDWAPEEWRPAIERCIWAIDALLEAKNVSRDLFVIEQIKEKYGGLRFYWWLDCDALSPRKGVSGKLWKDIGRAVTFAEEWVYGYEAAKEKYAPRIVKREKQPPAIGEDDTPETDRAVREDGTVLKNMKELGW